MWIDNRLFAAATVFTRERERTTLNQQQSGAPSSILRMYDVFVWFMCTVCVCVRACDGLTKCVILWRRDQEYAIILLTFQVNA